MLVFSVSACVTVEELEEFPLLIPPPSLLRRRREALSHTTIGLFSEGGAGIVTDKQQRRERWGLSWVAT